MKKVKLYSLILLLIIFSACHSNKSKTSENSIPNSIQLKYAELLNISPSQIENMGLYHFIDKWMGVKYKYGGTTTDGVDCSGFANNLYKEVYNKVLPRSSQDIAKEIQIKNSMSEGDLVLFNIDGKKNSHVGIYLKNNKFIHSSTSKGVIISSLDHPYYQKSFSKSGVIQ